MGPEKTTNSRLPFKISHLPLSPSSFPNLLCWFSPSSPQISCSSASPELRNRWRFRYYFQMLATADQLAQAFFAIVKEFQIQSRRVTIIEQNEKLFSVVSCIVKLGSVYVMTMFKVSCCNLYQKVGVYINWERAPHRWVLHEPYLSVCLFDSRTSHIFLPKKNKI